MNPMKALLDSFDHLINERGSANILRERLALAADQYSVLEKENTAIKLTAKQCEAEKQILKSEIQALKTKNEESKKKLREYEDFANSFPPNMVVPPEGIK